MTGEGPSHAKHGEEPGEAPALTSVHVQRAIAGESGSLSWLVGRLSPLLRAQADYRLGPKLRRIYDADDLVNDAWLVALPKLAELPARDGRHTPVLLRFLSTTIVYRIQNLVRKHARGQSVGLAPRDADASDISQEDARSGVVTRAVRAERHTAVHDAIAKLSESDREIVMLRGIEQQANQTVCVLLGLSKQAVSMRYRRALERLREQLPGSVFDELEESEDQD